MPCSFFDANTSFLCKLPEQPNSNFCHFHDRAFPATPAAAVVTHIKTLAARGPLTIGCVTFHELDFRDYRFEHPLTFEYCTFIRCEFRDLTFRDSFVMRESGYEDRLRFDTVTFEAAASFYRFSGSSQGADGVSFARMKFKGATDFRSSKFASGVAFGKCEFHAAATFDDGRWGGTSHEIGITDCAFSSASFERMTFNARRIHLKDPQCGAMTFAHSEWTAPYLEFFFKDDAEQRQEVHLAPKGGLVDFKAITFANAKPVCVFDKFTGAVDFSGVDLAGATLKGEVSGVILSKTILDRADLTEAEGAKYDKTAMRQTLLAPRAKDLWSELRRSYTGPMFALHLLLLLLFLAPFAVKAAWLHGLSEAQGFGRNVTEELQQRADDADQANDRVEAVRLRAVAATIREVAPCFEQAPKCIERPLAAVLIGLDEHPTGLARLKWWPLVLLLILYNICRAWLTYSTSLMRDAQGQTGYSPALDDYKGMRRLHRFMRYVVIFVGGSFVVRLVDLLFLTSIFVQRQ